MGYDPAWVLGCTPEGVPLGIQCDGSRGEPGVQNLQLVVNTRVRRVDGWGVAVKSDGEFFVGQSLPDVAELCGRLIRFVGWMNRLWGRTHSMG